MLLLVKLILSALVKVAKNDGSLMSSRCCSDFMLPMPCKVLMDKQMSLLYSYRFTANFLANLRHLPPQFPESQVVLKWFMSDEVAAKSCWVFRLNRCENLCQIVVIFPARLWHHNFVRPSRCCLCVSQQSVVKLQLIQTHCKSLRQARKPQCRDPNAAGRNSQTKLKVTQKIIKSTWNRQKEKKNNKQ